MRPGVLELAAAAAFLVACPDSHPAGRWDCGGNPCDDGEACNGMETCDPDRGCLPGAFIDCADADPCTMDSCVAGACAHGPRDFDSDGHADPCAGGDDCAPEDAAVHPGAEEVCNDRDDDCDLDIDEGLPFALLEETVFDVRGDGDSYRAVDAVLDDGTLVSVRPNEVVASREGLVETAPVRAEEEIGWATVTARLPSVVTDGTRVWSSSLWGPVLEGAGGERLRIFDSVATTSVTWDDALRALEERTVHPPDAERGWPCSLALGLAATGAQLAWSTPIRGVSEVLFTRIDGVSAPVTRIARAAGAGPVTGVALAADPVGATILWTESREPAADAIWAARVDADGATAAQVQIAEADHPRVVACALATGTAVVLSFATTEVAELRILHLDALLHSVDLDTLDSSDGIEIGDEFAVRCAGASVWLAGPGWLRRIGLDGEVQVEVETTRLATAMIASRGIAFATTPDSTSEPYVVERYGCVQ